jgi:uncharacterized protein (DUF488 family)
MAQADVTTRALTIWTIGHSTRTLGEFVGLLRAHRIEAVADVRALPRSRRHPHFSGQALAQSLEEAGIGYAHVPDLGGLRKPRRDSRNTGWRDEAFRGYADHMETARFAAGLRELLAGAKAARTAVMCAEADWRECHRGLIADALKVRGARVLHIVGKAEPEEHPYTKPARVKRGNVSYEGEGLFGAA